MCPVVRSRGTAPWTTLAVFVRDRHATLDITCVAEARDLSGVAGIGWSQTQSTTGEGDQVVTSTQSVLYPPGLLIGLVISVSDTDELFKRIIIEPSAPLAELDSVLVITSFEPRDLEPPE